MSLTDLPQPNTSFATLRRFVREKAPIERCELCNIELTKEHQHLIEPLNRRLICACDACAILFGSQESGKYRCVPKQIRFLPDFRLTDAQWDSLLIPINMAFFFHSTAAGRVVALYPSPAGPTESLLTLESWEEIIEENPILKEMKPDVEALLVKRLHCAEFYLVPIDECYKLVGLIRANWRGFSGGTEVWEEIGRFFSALKERGEPQRHKEK